MKTELIMTYAPSLPSPEYAHYWLPNHNQIPDAVKSSLDHGSIQTTLNWRINSNNAQ